MKKKLALPWLLAGLVGLFAAAGCERDNSENPPTGVGSTEQTAMKYYAENDEFVKNDEATFSDNEIEPTDYGTFGGLDAGITPLRFGRFIRNVSKTVTVEIQPGDSIAIAHVAKAITGVFKIRALTLTGDTVLIEKPFRDNADRNIVFKRVNRRVDRFWENWVPVATSLVAGETAQTTTPISITKLELFLANGDTITITDPTHYYLRLPGRRIFQGGQKDVPEVLSGQRLIVRATVLSSSADTDFVALRYGAGPMHRRRQRMQLVSESPTGNGFTRVFQTAFFMHSHPGHFHAGVDAMTRGTLFDDTDPYSVSWWGVPYRVF